MYSNNSIENPMNELASKLSSVSLGSTKFTVGDKSIMCGLDSNSGDNIYPLAYLNLDDSNILRYSRIRSMVPKNDPSHSYAVTLLELVSSLDGLGYNEAIEFINKLSKKG